MRNFPRTLIFIISLSLGFTGFSQSEIADLMKTGDHFIVKGEFGNALEIFKKVVEQDPKNADANFKLGLCYRNSYDQQTKALPYLRIASKEVDKNYHFNKNGSSAPYDAFYFLGEIYLMINEVDSAYDAFRTYENAYDGKTPIPDVDHQIINCMNALRAKKTPRDVHIARIGGGLNTNFAENKPVITMDNSLMFFASRRVRKDGSNINDIDPNTGTYYDDIYLAQKDGQGNWQNAGIFKLSSTGSEAPLCLSADGKTLYFRKFEHGNYNIYQSTFEDGVWGDPKALGSSINSAFDEMGASISGDGKYLYFSSNREGGKGKLDIYRSTLKSNGHWGIAENITSINSSYNEQSPFIHPNGKTLFFSTNGNHNKGMGGYDIYYCEQDDNGNWSEPENLGYPINTSRDDIDFYITSGGVRYYSSIDENNSYDIFEIQGGGYEFEEVDALVEVVTLTQEMNVTEVLEVIEEKEVEVEVIETIETEVIVEREVEVKVIDYEAMEALQKEIDAANTEKAKADAEKAKAEAEIIKAQAEIAAAERVKAEAQKAEAEAKKAEAKVAEAEARRVEAEAELATAQAKIAEAQAKIADAEKAKALAQAAKEERKMTNAKAKLAKVEEAQARAEEEKQRAITETAAAEKAKAQAEIDKAATEKAEAEAIIAATAKAEAEATIAAAKQTEAQLAIEQETAKRLSLEKEKAEAETKLKEAEAQKAKAEAEIADANASKIAAEKAKEAQTLAETKMQEAQLKSKEAQTLAETKVQEAQLKVKEALTETEKAKIAQTEADNARQKATSELEASKVTQTALEQKLSQQKEIQSKLETEIAELKIQIANSKNELQSTKDIVSKLTADKTSLENEKQTLITEKQKLGIEIDDLRNKNKQLSVAEVETKKQIDQLQADNANRTTEVEKLTIQLQQLETQLNDLKNKE